MQVLLATLLLLPSTLLAAPSAGVLTSKSGAVFIKGREVRAAITNQNLYPGETLITGSDGSAKVLLRDDSLMDLGPGSSFKIDQFIGDGSENRQASFTVLYGRLRALVTKALKSGSKFDVRTPDSVMGVRGTEFIVNIPRDGRSATRTEVTVVTGAVQLAMPRLGADSVSIPAGSQLVAALGQTSLPQPTALSAAQLSSIATTARVRDLTFDNTVSLEAKNRNESAPHESTSRALASDHVAATTQLLASSDEKAGSVDAVGSFGLLDNLNDVPVTVLPGMFRQVDVKLSP